MSETRRDELLRIVKEFQEVSIALATGANVGYERWEDTRASLLSQPELLRVLPDWIARCRWGSQFWQHIKTTAATYAERRTYIWDELRPVVEAAENGTTQPTAISLEPLLRRATSSTVAEAWARIQARREIDPEGSITAARAMLETTCKYVLTAHNIPFGEAEELPKLYNLAAKTLGLAPQQHKEDVFKQILGGCISVANGLAGLRNAFGDAHGKAPSAPRPSPRHADLAINLAGALSAFLIATHEEKMSSP